ncbi:putative nucleic acid-binding protein, contains PIN domain [Metallosphaera yellowstonensis MK1]|jgi:Predicted nucleic acid-binding protein, contains PIN domain|uniref:Ribonuclease VapC n=1 Tax=Metallosphaera yellowstonensis MK1 TaxID=671065 RepID=H2C5C3_9CREN|nr:type II toxin-antitoxin system VapC family toxin [Metallosphaera yellowstonensis]EHP69000.1 putative nucleic acid-binding protein, contains PIN domain [Metallosphaera yellowstonensis MK1]
MTLIDTSILIDFLKGRIKYLGDSISIISLMEVGRVIENKRRLEVLKTLEDMFTVYPIDEKVAVEYAELYYQLREKGRLIADLDLIIASTAKAHDEKLLTRDKDFLAVKEYVNVEII